MMTKKGIYNNLTDSLDCIDAAASLKNKTRLGHATPREEFVESVEHIDIIALSNKWKIEPHYIRKIAREEDWRGQRVRFVNDVREMEKRILKGDIADLRLKEVTKNTALWDAMRSVMINIAQKGTTTEMSPTGATWERPIDPRGFHDLVKAAEVIGKNVNEQFKMIRGDDTEAVDVTVPVRVTQIVYNATEDPSKKSDEKVLPESQNNALPAPSQVNNNSLDSLGSVNSNVVEGEIE